jgi:hypothetical protein
MTDTSNSAPDAPTAHGAVDTARAGTQRDPVSGRWLKGNRGAVRKHGLRAGTRKELRRRDTRTSRLLGRYQVLRADEGRPIGATMLPLARAYCEAEIRRRDLWAALQADPQNTRLHEMWISTVRAQGGLAAALGETMSAKARFLALAEPDDPVSQLVRYRQQRALEAARNGAEG